MSKVELLLVLLWQTQLDRFLFSYFPSFSWENLCPVAEKNSEGDLNLNADALKKKEQLFIASLCCFYWT